MLHDLKKPVGTTHVLNLPLRVALRSGKTAESDQVAFRIAESG
jgi:hypothetical protein